MNFNESSAIKSGKVFIPKEIVDELPTTTDSYTLGYFIAGFGLYQNVGKVDLVSGQDKEIFLGRDLMGNNGYAIGDTLITVLRNNSTLNTYIVEFNYTNDARTYYSGYSDSVVSIKKSTWAMDPFLGQESLCTIDGDFNMNFPFGLTPTVQVSPTEGLTVNNYSIDIKSSSPGDYTVTYTSEHTWNKKSYEITVLDASTEELNSVISICDGETEIISTVENEFTRSPLAPTTGFVADFDGEMYFTVEFLNGCISIDTVTVKQGELDLSDVNFIIDDEQCPGLGAVTIVNVVSNYNVIQYKLEDETSDVGEFSNLRSKDYIAIVIDDLGCEHELPTFSIEKDQNCDGQDAILETNSENNYIQIEEAEDITIIDRNGTTVFSSIGPLQWYGTSNDGSPLPVGLYFILIGDSTQKTVTIVR